jgi:predicted TIM-barrel fold metal-dependent hydrolase
VKISGIGIPKRPWTTEDNRPVVLDTIAAFGAERCMFASNFPVDSVVADYDTIFDGFRAITAHLPEADRRKLFHDNAKRVYRIAL